MGCLLSTKRWTLTSNFPSASSALCNQKVCPLPFLHGQWLNNIFYFAFFSLFLHLTHLHSFTFFCLWMLFGLLTKHKKSKTAFNLPLPFSFLQSKGVSPIILTWKLVKQYFYFTFFSLSLHLTHLQSLTFSCLWMLFGLLTKHKKSKTDSTFQLFAIKRCVPYYFDMEIG